VESIVSSAECLVGSEFGRVGRTEPKSAWICGQRLQLVPQLLLAHSRRQTANHNLWENFGN